MTPLKPCEAYNSAIAACGSEWQMALLLWQDLEERSLRPDAVTCGSLISACEKAPQSIWTSFKAFESL